MSAAQIIAFLLSLSFYHTQSVRLLLCCSVTEGQLHDTLTLLGGIDLRFGVNRNQTFLNLFYRINMIGIFDQNQDVLGAIFYMPLQSPEALMLKNLQTRASLKSLLVRAQSVILKSQHESHCQEQFAFGGIDITKNEVIVAYSSGLDKTTTGRQMLEHSDVKLLSFEAKNDLIGRIDENSIWDQVAVIKRNSLVLKALVAEEGFIEGVRELNVEVLIIGQEIYEYQVALTLNVPFLQVISNPFGIMQLFNDVLSPQSSLSTTFLSQVYPDILTRYSLVGRFVNHVCILQQELMLKPAIQVAYSKGISKYIPFIQRGGAPNKVIIVGPAFIEQQRLQTVNGRMSHFMPTFTYQSAIDDSSGEVIYIEIGPHIYPSKRVQEQIASFITKSKEQFHINLVDIGFIDQNVLQTLINSKNARVIFKELKHFPSKCKAFISNPGKDKLVKALLNQVPLIAFQGDVSESTLCKIMQDELQVGICANDGDFQGALDTLTSKYREIRLNIDINYEQIVRAEIPNQSKLQYHIEQLWYESLSNRGSEGIGYFKSHDYDLLMMISIILSVGFVLSYIVVCDVLYLCCCAKPAPQKKKKND